MTTSKNALGALEAWRDDVTDYALVERINAAPDMGGESLKELARVLERRTEMICNDKRDNAE